MIFLFIWCLFIFILSFLILSNKRNIGNCRLHCFELSLFYLIIIIFDYHLNSKFLFRRFCRTFTVKPDVLLMGGNFANFRRNIGIWLTVWVEQVATCASNLLTLVPRGKNWTRATKMFQVLLQYFEDRLASFFVDEPLTNYQDLLDRVKKLYPCLKALMTSK